MNFAIIGAGNVGTAITRAVTEAGHDAVVSARTAGSLESLAAEVPVVTTVSNADAVSRADVVVLAVPFTAAPEIAARLADGLAGKIVIDVTNQFTAGLTGLANEGESVAEQVARAAPQARVVKAFNTVFAGNQATAEVDGVQLKTRNDWSWRSGWKLVGPLA